MSLDERKELGAVARKRNAAAVKVQRAKVMLAVDIGPGGPGLTDSEASAGDVPQIVKTGWLSEW